MKFTVTFKDPDGPCNSIEEAGEQCARSVSGFDQMHEDEQQDLIESRREKIKKLCDRWFRYGEYVDIEIDTDAGTATVLPAK